MALSSLLRKASSPALPFAVRAIGSIHGVPRMPALNVHSSPSSRLHQSHNYGSVATPSKRKVDEQLVRIINSQIKGLKRLQEMPKELSFDIQYMHGDGILSLTKKDQDELIKVQIEISSLHSEDSSCEDSSCQDISDDSDDDSEDDRKDGSRSDTKNDNKKKNDADSDDASDEDYDDSADDSNNEEVDKSAFPMVVQVEKGDGFFLEFDVIASPYNISIANLSVMESDNDEIEEAPAFHVSDMDSRLTQALQKYLEIRGIKPSLVEFLHKFAIHQNREEELAWLKKLKRFIKN